MLIGHILLPVKRLSNIIFPTIMSREQTTWQEEKAKYLEEDYVSRRQNYGKTAFVTLDKIPTWVEQSKEVPMPNDKKADLQPNTTLNSKISLWQGDITVLEIDALVNAANSRLAGGGGVDGAIHKAAGPYLLKECQSIGGCPTGQVKLTGGYRLPAKYVIQTVGPMKPDPSLLSSCYSNSLKLASQSAIKSIAFPCISTGVYGYPNRDAAEVALSTTRKFLEEDSSFERVIFCVFLDIDVNVYKELLPIYFPASNL